jgi:hypothetical protein
MAICFATVLYVIIASSMWGESSPNMGIGFPNPMKELYIPSALAAGICGIISVFQIIWSKNKPFFVVCFFTCIPMIAYYSYRPEFYYMKGYRGDEKMVSEFEGQSRYSLLYYVLTYYELHPERFHPTDEADVVKIDGFVDYIQRLSPPLKWANDQNWQSDKSDRVIIKNNQIVAPWGSPIIFLLNTSENGFIKARSRELDVNVLGSQRPNFKYKVAVGITTSDKPGYLHSRYNFDNEIPMAVLTDTDVHDPSSTGSGPDWHLKRSQ